MWLYAFLLSIRFTSYTTIFNLPSKRTKSSSKIMNNIVSVFEISNEISIAKPFSWLIFISPKFLLIMVGRKALPSLIPFLLFLSFPCYLSIPLKVCVCACVCFVYWPGLRKTSTRPVSLSLSLVPTWWVCVEWCSPYWVHFTTARLDIYDVYCFTKQVTLV